jgi:hypothetical protein
MNDELERTWKVDVSLIDVISQHFAGGTEDNYETPQSR